MATMPEIDEMFTIDPPPARRMAGMACFVPKNTPFAFTAMMRSQSPSLVSSIPLRITLHPLFTRQSRFPGHIQVHIGGFAARLTDFCLHLLPLFIQDISKHHFGAFSRTQLRFRSA